MGDVPSAVIEPAHMGTFGLILFALIVALILLGVSNKLK